jgi:hypothetical protein
MTPKQKLDALKAQIDNKASFIAARIVAIELLIAALSIRLYQIIETEFIDKLDVSDGKIEGTAKNFNKLSSIELAYDFYLRNEAIKLAQTLSTDLLAIQDLNEAYFQSLQSRRVNNTGIRRVVNASIGITVGGALSDTGSIARIIQSNEVLGTITTVSANAIQAELNVSTVRKSIKDLITGKTSEGLLKSTLLPQIEELLFRADALSTKLYAKEIGLTHFIYNGTLRAASRCFCTSKKGKVFSIDEALGWKALIGSGCGPIVTKQDIATYDPLIDRGGYNCVDIISYITQDMYEYLQSN